MANPLTVFTAAYGRQCSLAAQALAGPEPYHRHAVYMASIGKGLDKDPTLRAIARQHGKVQEAWKIAHRVGCTTTDLVAAARRVHLAIEGEWYVRLPMHSESRKVA